MYRKTFISLCVLCFSAMLSAQPQIRPDHPRIFFNADTWPAIKEKALGEKRAYLDKLLDEVNQMTDLSR